MVKEILIDAEGTVLGRLASFAAKQALLGGQVRILNSEKALISGTRADILRRYRAKIARGGTAQKGPFFPRTAIGIARRTVRGMLPWKIKKGKLAFKRVLCYEGIPSEFKDKEKISLKLKKPEKAITLHELCSLLRGGK